MLRRAISTFSCDIARAVSRYERGLFLFISPVCHGLDQQSFANQSARASWFGRGPDPSADLLCQLDDDSLGAADVAEPVFVLIALQLADELRAAGSQAGDDGVDVFNSE